VEDIKVMKGLKETEEEFKVNPKVGGYRFLRNVS
jgi:hypothetical protein